MFNPFDVFPWAKGQPCKESELMKTVTLWMLAAAVILFPGVGGSLAFAQGGGRLLSNLIGKSVAKNHLCKDSHVRIFPYTHPTDGSSGVMLDFPYCTEQDKKCLSQKV